MRHLLPLLLLACGAPPDRWEGDSISECEDGEDNDGDKRFDCADPGCAQATVCLGRDSAAPDTDTDPPPAAILLTADAGPDRVGVDVGQTIGLQGRSTPGRGTLGPTYTWTLRGRPAGSDTQLQAIQGNRASFLADAPGTYHAQLDVFDGIDHATDAVAFEVRGDNILPWAVVAPTDPQVPIGQPKLIDGSLSFDRDGDTLSYQWTLLARPVGAMAMPETPNSATLRIVPDVIGRYFLQLVVHDGTMSSQPALVELRAYNPAVTAP